MLVAVPQVAVPTYGEWLDVYLTVLKPLPMPVGGLLGERSHPPWTFQLLHESCIALGFSGMSLQSPPCNMTPRCAGTWNMPTQAPPTSPRPPARQLPHPAVAA